MKLTNNIPIIQHLLIDGAAWYMSLGSWSAGIELMELNPSTGGVKSSATTLISGRPTGSKAEEASWIYKTGGWSTQADASSV